MTVVRIDTGILLLMTHPGQRDRLLADLPQIEEFLRQLAQWDLLD
jgi:hypothetical protein